ncbi:hypothetical protein DH2020_035697 [Rehmannia glutinosa]|uniref:MFS transporter n=1 Tax=Rehmannia glutinosa TaxID=99300 RepID=A0ABR0V6G7_REHGL
MTIVERDRQPARHAGPGPSSRPDRVRLRTLFRVASVAGGIQFGWALQLSLLTPYVQELGIPHAWASIIWLCGPLSGLLVQPLVGHFSDRCTSRFGRRRPFILAGALSIVIAVIIIGHASDIGWLLGDRGQKKMRAVVAFVIGFWLLDVANNMTQGPCRALLADLTGKTTVYLPGTVWIILLVTGLTWIGWFPFLLFDTDWMGREIYGGKPNEGMNYSNGVRMGSLGLMLNSVILGITSLFMEKLCRKWGAGFTWGVSNILMSLCFVAMLAITAIRSNMNIDGHLPPDGVIVASLIVFAFLGIPLAVIVSLGSGPWDQLFGGGNSPAILIAAISAFAGGLIAILAIPRTRVDKSRIRH